jgi:hypothetical protein
MAYEIKVSYMSRCCPDEEFPSYFISLESDKYYFSIGEPYCYSDKEIDAVLEGTGGIDGGGNSYWSLTSMNGKFELEYCISGSGLGSTFCWTVDDIKPIVEMLELVKKINKLKEKGKMYASSQDHIKVSI